MGKKPSTDLNLVKYNNKTKSYWRRHSNYISKSHKSFMKYLETTLYTYMEKCSKYILCRLI